MTATISPTRWVSTTDVLEHLGVGRSWLRAAMEATPPDLRPWVAHGTGRRTRYRWNASEIDAWWREVHRGVD